MQLTLSEHHPHATHMSAMLKSYGIVNHGLFEWLIKQDDLVLSNLDTVLHSSEFFRNMYSSNEKDYDFKVFRYPAEGVDDAADRPKQWEDGQNGENVACTIWSTS